MRLGTKPYENAEHPTLVAHKGTPAEPFAVPHQHGEVVRVAPGKYTSQMAYVVWSVPEGETWFGTWELVRDLRRL